MRVLLVGLGSIGSRHLANLRTIYPEASVTAWRHHRVRDGQAPLLAGVDRFVYQVDDAIAVRPDCVLITGPASQHVSTALPFAERGIPLFIEKPLSDSLDEADKLLSACARGGVTPVVGYNLRFSRALQDVKRALTDGMIGRVLALRAEVGQYLPDWRPESDYRRGVSARSEHGGGALLELSHEIDYVRWLVGEVSSVGARVGRLSDLEIDVEDVAEIVMEFRNGAIGNIHLDMVQRAATRTCRLIGVEGTIVWDGVRQHAAIFSAASRSWTDLCPADGGDRNEMYVAELRHFLDCVSGRAVPLITGHDGRRVLEIALAARRSSLEGRTVTL